MGEIQCLTVYHPSHQHPLIPGCRQRQILAECDACGEEHKGVFYECSTCFSSLMHADCVFKPKRLLIQDATNGRFSHTHPLILAYSFPRIYQKEKFYPTCRVCENSLSDSENLWIYKCEKCRFYIHLKCIDLRYTPSNSGVDGTSKENQDNDPSIVLHLPFFDQTQNMFTELFSRETNTKSITHESHQHPLILVGTMSNVQDLCDGCLRPIMDMPYYRCNNSNCYFVLHELCTRLPSTLDKTCPSKHSLHLNQKAIRPNAFCRVCNHFCKGFFYSCLNCEYNYTVDVSCALIIKTITHKCHSGHQLSRVEERLQKDYCRMCLSGFKSKKETSYSCGTCDFHLHVECAFSLPETTGHKYDKHPMTLTYSPVENHEGDYFCEVCEEELNPYISFYHCHECAQSIHSACVQKPLPKSYTLYGLNEKCDSKDTHHNKFHAHPLSFFKGTLSNRGCSQCHLSLKDDFILECPQCKFATHAGHLNEEAGFLLKYMINLRLWYPGHPHELHFTYGIERLRRLGFCSLNDLLDRGTRNMVRTDAPLICCSYCSLLLLEDDYVFHCLEESCAFIIHAYHINKRNTYRRGTRPSIREVSSLPPLPLSSSSHSTT